MKFLLIFLSLFGLTFAQDYLCEDVPDFTFLPSDQSCSLYFECIGGIAIEHTCPDNQYFDLNTSECDDAENVECYLDPTEPPSSTTPGPGPPVPEVSCAGLENFEYLISEVSCSEYFQCIDGEAFLLSCPRGLYFSRNTFRCVYPSEADCVLTLPTPPTPPPSPPPNQVTCDGVENFEYLPSEVSCSEYFQCIDGEAYLLSCPRGLYFSRNTFRCDYPSEADCVLTLPTPPPTPMPTPPPIPVSCEGVPNFRFIPSQQSCANYYQCIYGNAFLLSCPRGLYFSERIQTCDYPFYVDDCAAYSPESTTSPPQDVSCEDVEDFRFIEHPTSCALFYQCIDQIEILNSCPVGRYFDQQIQTCADSQQVDCGGRIRRPTTTTQAPIIDPLCVNVAEGAFVENLFSCTSYYQCLSGRAMPRFCDDGLWFDEGLQRCDVPANVNCHSNTIPTAPTDSPPTFTPPNEANICDDEPDESYVASRMYCDRFYFCSGGVASPNECQTGNWFDRELRECRPIDEVDCTLETLPTTTVITTTTDSSPAGMCREARNGTYISHRMACSEFFVCINDEPHGRACQDGLWFDFNQQRCVPPYATWCELDPIVCLGIENDVLVRAPASCSEFLSCINGRPFPGRCWGDLFFNEESQLCESRDLVECDLEVPTEEPRHNCDGIPDFRLAASDDSCSEYLVCYSNEILFTLECPDGQNFDLATQVCGEEFECLL